MENRRKHVRINKSLEVSFRKARDFMRSGARNKNISESGVCLPTAQYFSVGSLLEVEISLIDFKAPVKAVARVMWIVKKDDGNFPFEVGLEFLEILPAQRDMLRDYIKHNLPEKGQEGMRWVQ